MSGKKNAGPLAGVRVFDMSRILAGPSATQILGDMGAEVIKIEKPSAGDDTRQWGPPFLKGKDGKETKESGYYLSANRNKKSLTLDFTKSEGLKIAKKLIASCDILFENYKVGGLDKYGLSYNQLKNEFPRLIYCSLTGFGQTGPYKDRAGYDYLIQGMGGVMSLNGSIDGDPYKMPVAFADIMAGLYSLNGILAALYAREKTGRGQQIDIALLDAQVAVMSNVAQYYLTSGKIPPRMGNAHLTIVPYEVFRAADGHIVLAVGNDRQFHDFCALAERLDLANDEQFATNQMRVRNRETLVPMVRDIIAGKPSRFWLEKLEKADVPCGPVNTIDQVFNDPQVQARGMVHNMPHPLAHEDIKLIANPLRFSETPVSYRHAPPLLGQDTQNILEGLGLSNAEIATLQEKEII